MGRNVHAARNSETMAVSQNNIRKLTWRFIPRRLCCKNLASWG
jgi:hypothetical protein